MPDLIVAKSPRTLAMQLGYARHHLHRSKYGFDLMASEGASIMAADPAKPTVFLSYASADRDRVQAMARALAEAGVQTWMDRSDIAGGDFWAAEIANAIEQCALLAVVCTSASMTSRNVRQELQLAWDFDRPIIPLVLDSVSFPPEVAYFLHGRQWIEIDDGPESVWVARVTSFLQRHSGSAIEAGARPGSMSTTPLRLPSSSTSLVGRLVEIEHANALLDDPRVRVLTVTGPGGVGKTRLALEVARRRALQAGVQCAFVDMAPLTDPALLPPAIAVSVGIREIGTSALIDILAEVMSGTPWLLLLDNAEHLLASAPLVAELVQSCQSLTVLITSRQPLHIRGEHELHLDPLPVPPGQRESRELVAQNDAVQLFLSRAQEIRADFELTDANAGDIAAIVRQLDGLPLAIELAAPRIRMLSPAALLMRLQDRLGVLTGGARDAPARQQTLRSTIEWSYDLLTESEQSLLATLAVFEGGFELDAAEAVAGRNHDLFEEIPSLLEKSLLQRRELRDGEPRFRMLESIRAFGLEQLDQHGQTIQVRQRHVAHYLTFARSLERISVDRPVPDWYARSIEHFDRELDNLRAAWRWRQQSGDTAGALELIAALRLFWVIRPYAFEVLDVLTSGLHDAPEAPERVRAMCELIIATLAGWIGEFDRAYVAADRGLALALATEDPVLIGRAYVFRGGLFEAAGECERSAAEHREAVTWLRRAPNDIHLGVALGEWGDRLLTCGSIADAIPLLDEALAFDRWTAYGFALAIVLGQRAHAARLTAELDLAIRLFQESIAVADPIADDRRVLGALIGLAGVAHAGGDSARAALIIGATESARQARGVSRVIAHPIHNELILAEIQQALGPDRYAELVARGRSIPYEAALALACQEPATDG